MQHNLSLSTRDSQETFENIIRNFRKTLSQCKKNQALITEAWQASLPLQELMFGKKVNFGTSYSPYFCKLSLHEIADIFRLTLSNLSFIVAKKIWLGNASLSAFYCGYIVVDDEDKANIQLISASTLQANFRSALVSRNSFIVEEMWKHNQRLHDLISMLDSDTGKDFLQRVMNLYKTCSPLFLNYINMFNASNLPIVREVMNGFNSNKVNRDTKEQNITNKYRALAKCLKKLKSLKELENFSFDEVSNADGSFNHSQQLVSEAKNKADKRSPENVAESFPLKRAKTTASNLPIANALSGRNALDPQLFAPTLFRFSYGTPWASFLTIPLVNFEHEQAVPAVDNIEVHAPNPTMTTDA